MTEESEDIPSVLPVPTIASIPCTRFGSDRGPVNLSNMLHTGYYRQVIIMVATLYTTLTSRSLRLKEPSPSPSISAGF